LILKFIAHHLWDADERAVNSAHGMSDDVARVLISAGHLRALGPHAPATVKRRLSNWATLHRWRNLQGDFSTPGVRSALKLAVRANLRPRSRKSARAVTGDVLEEMLATCASDSLIDRRDSALLLLAFGSGGRRRSEIAKLRVEDLRDETPTPAESESLPSLSLRLGRTKTTSADVDARAYVAGRPVIALKAWLDRSGIVSGAIFRAIDRWGRASDRALTPQSVNLIVKQRCIAAGLDPAAYSAHGLRSGFLTEAARQGVPLPEAMRQSQHRSVQQAANYYNDAGQGASRAARLLD
jgi:integrase